LAKGGASLFSLLPLSGCALDENSCIFMVENILEYLLVRKKE